MVIELCINNIFEKHLSNKKQKTEKSHFLTILKCKCFDPYQIGTEKHLQNIYIFTFQYSLII